MGKCGAWRLLWPPIFRRLAPLKRVAYSVSSSVCHNVHWASLGIRLVGPGFVSFPWPRRATVIHAAGPPLPRAASRACGGPIFRRLAPLKRVTYSVSSSVCHNVHWASLGIRQSPRGDMATVPTLGPSGRQLRLNCWLKKRR